MRVRNHWRSRPRAKLARDTRWQYVCRGTVWPGQQHGTGVVQYLNTNSSQERNITVSEALEQVQFVVGPDGQPTAAIVEIATWQALLSLLEEAEDQAMLRAYLARRWTARSPEEMGLMSWEQTQQG